MAQQNTFWQNGKYLTIVCLCKLTVKWIWIKFWIYLFHLENFIALQFLFTCEKTCQRVKLPCNGHVIDMESTRCQVIITKGLSQTYQKKRIKVKILPTCNIEKLLFQCKTSVRKLNTIWKAIEDAYISIDCACFLPISRTSFLFLERIPYIVVSQEICSSNIETLGLYLKDISPSLTPDILVLLVFS